MRKLLSRRITVRIGRLRVGLAIGHLLVLSLIVAVGVGVWITFATSVFGVRAVAVEGTTTVTKSQIRTVAAVQSGTPLARLDTAAVSARVRKLPEVARAEVFRAWPHTLRIVVTERVAVAVSREQNRFALIDATGVAFRVVDAPPPLPTIDIEHLHPGNRTTMATLDVAQALTPELVGVLDSITATAPSRISLNLTDGRTIFWGDNSRSSHKARVATAVLSRPGEYIDVSAPGVVTAR